MAEFLCQLSRLCYEYFLGQEPTSKNSDPASGIANHQIHQPKSHGKPTKRSKIKPPKVKLKVEVVRSLYKNQTLASVLSEGLIALSHAMSTLNNLNNQPFKTPDEVESENILSKEIARIITTVVNIMAAVRDKSKPKVIRAYHAYATKTAVAGWFAARGILVEHVGEATLSAVLVHIFSAYVHFGMAVLVTPNDRAAHLVNAIETAVAKSTQYTHPLSQRSAGNMAREISFRISVSSFASSLPSKAPPLPESNSSIKHSPLNTIFTSPLSKRKLAGIARSRAVKYQFYHDMDGITQTAHSLEASLYPYRGCTHCKSVCLCTIWPVSSIELLLGYHIRLIPGL